MCGIAGWFDTKGDRPPNRDLVKAMALSIQHRGPDGEGFHFEPGVGFAHRRLAIIDLATGEQPMFSEDGSVVIVFNGEIYNYIALRHELESLGYLFRTKSDTEVILNAWRAWNVSCLARLQGMFAFAIWDRSKQLLCLARDKLGEKPLYYSFRSDGGLVFASELKALLVDPSLPRKIDATAVQDFFSLGYVPDPKCIYEGVKKLEAGHYLVLEKNKPASPRKYWDAEPTSYNGRDFQANAEELRSRLSDIVRAQLVADVPVGTFLSGGVDSSTITAIAAQQTISKLSAFTIGFEEREFDERAYASKVASQYGLDQHSELASIESGDIADELANIFDEPFGDSSAIPTLIVCRLARRNVKVALSGDGGDELFAGYRRYAFHRREELFRKALPAAVRKPLFGILGKVYPQLDWMPRYLRARHTFQELSYDTAEGYFHNISVLDSATVRGLLSPSLSNQVTGYATSDLIASYVRQAPTDDPVAIAQYVDLKTWLVGDILTKVDRTAMAASLEVRVPMLDGDLVRWALGLPQSFKLSGHQGKRVLKKAAEALLPNDILYRRKQGFSVPLALWFRGRLGDALERETTSHAALAEFINLNQVKLLLSEHRSGWADHSRALWLIFVFKSFIDKVHLKAATAPLATRA